MLIIPQWGPPPFDGSLGPLGDFLHGPAGSRRAAQGPDDPTQGGAPGTTVTRSAFGRATPQGAPVTIGTLNSPPHWGLRRPYP